MILTLMPFAPTLSGRHASAFAVRDPGPSPRTQSNGAFRGADFQVG